MTLLKKVKKIFKRKAYAVHLVENNLDESLVDIVGIASSKKESIKLIRRYIKHLQGVDGIFDLCGNDDCPCKFRTYETGIGLLAIRDYRKNKFEECGEEDFGIFSVQKLLVNYEDREMSVLEQYFVGKDYELVELDEVHNRYYDGL